MGSISVNVEVDVEDILDSMSSSDIKRLRDSLSEMGDGPVPEPTTTAILFEAYRSDNKDRLDQLLRSLFWTQLGKVT